MTTTAPSPGPTRTADPTPTDGRRPHRGDLVRGGAVLLAAVLQIVGSPLGTALSGRSVGDLSDATPNLLTPAGYAFAIWGPIFALSLAWAVYQLLPSQRGREIHRVVGWPLALAFLGNFVWEVVYPFGGAMQVVSNVLIFGITAATAVAFVRMQRVDLTGQGVARVLPRFGTGLLLGWVTVAPVANTASTGVYLGADGETSYARILAVVALVAVAAIAVSAVMWSRAAAGAFALSVVWGVTAIAAAGYPAVVTLTAWVVAAVVVLAVVVAAARAGHRGRRAGTVLVG